MQGSAQVGQPVRYVGTWCPDMYGSVGTVVDAPEHLRLVTVRFDVPRSQSITVCLPLEVLEIARTLEASPGSNG